MVNRFPAARLLPVLALETMKTRRLVSPPATVLSVLPTPSDLFFWLSLNLKSKICLNWLQRARGGFVSTVMRVLIGPEAQAANRPLLVRRGPLPAR